MSNRFVIYTPLNIVEKMLDLIEYKNENILKKHIIDNSCGEGSFLISIAEKYINEYIKNNKNFNLLCKELETYIHGIEINIESVKKTKKSLDCLLKKYKINKFVNWDIVCGDALKIDKFNFKMDFVVGNPPYVNIHNLKEIDYKQFNFTKKGMVDLYLIFFEIGIKMLNKKGKLIYITPNSFLTSKAGETFKKEIIQEKLITKYVDNNHTLIFKNVQTYTGITLLDMSNRKKICKYSNIETKIKKELN